MGDPTLSAEQTLAWVERTSGNWRRFLAENPAILALPCDIYKTAQNVSDLLQHIVAVELRYAQRLAGLAESPYEDVPKDSVEAIYTTHDQAMDLVRGCLADNTRDWSEEIEFDTIALGRIAASRHAVLFHVLLHSTRHYGQLATLVRQHGFKTSFPMDYLMMAARRV